MVTWRGLAELQAQNQRLISIARDLASQLEKHESSEAETEKNIANLSTRIDSLQGEVDLARLAAKEARSEASVAVSQRNTYRQLLEEHGIEVAAMASLPGSDTEVSGDNLKGADISHSDSFTSEHKQSSLRGGQNSPVASRLAVDRLEDTISSLRTEFQRYRKDKSESDQVYTSTIDQLRKESNDARILNQKLSSQLP
ncbi:unnamed protein product [Protopolystoma xenopodis]|uniref:NUA/TPR/MLP1-2-like domain-containing protein n=1 Tax=Protopolystoma xenopodis TaxID=117903 RepID=A0A3S5FCF8_9PLAT|nr:unnamed protein product [Protopolystoma xenopodis]